MPTFTIENVRISYPHLFAPKQIGGQGDPKYSAAFLIGEDNLQFKELLAAAAGLVNAAYPKGTPPNFKNLPMMKGEEKHPGNSDYEGVYVINSSKNPAQGKPSVVDQNMQPVIDPGLVYPGMVVNVALSVYVYNNVSRGVTVGLEAVQLVRDGERLDNKPGVGELFKPIDVVGGTPPATKGFNPLG